MTDKELLQMALDALDTFNDEYGWGEKQKKTFEAIKARLAQPEPVLVSPKEFIAAVTGKWDITGIPMVMSVWPTPEETVNGWPLFSGLPQPEPVAFVTNKRQRINIEFKPEVFSSMPTTIYWEIPLYTAPQKKEWVGLMDMEKHEIQSLKWWDWEDTFDVDGYTRAVEAKLKEKNT